MGEDIFSRNKLFWGEDNQYLLSLKHVAVFGLGGVGGFCAEALVRAGIGELSIVDFDDVSLTNINRQLVALYSTVGQNKAKLFENRLKDINPELKINVVDDFYTGDFDFSHIDYVADAIDTMKSKIELLETSVKNNISVITVGTNMKLINKYVNCSSFNTSEEVITFLSDLNITDCCILLKGSRGMHLEKIKDALIINNAS